MLKLITAVAAILSLSTGALADAYMCSDGKTKFVSTEPCGATSRTVRSAQSISQHDAAASAATARRDLERQGEWLDRRYEENAAYARAQQEIQRQAASQQAAYERQKQIAAQRAAAMEMEKLRAIQERQFTPPNTVAVPPPQRNDPPQRIPTSIADQGNGFMRDNTGNNYLKNGDFLYRNDGTRCLRNGDTYNCRR